MPVRVLVGVRVGVRVGMGGAGQGVFRVGVQVRVLVGVRFSIGVPVRFRMGVQVGLGVLVGGPSKPFKRQKGTKTKFSSGKTGL